MKKALFIALALVAGASSFTANAVKKKMVMAPVQEKVEPVVLASSSDSVSYAAGMTMTNGLVPFLLQQKMDTTLMSEFVRSFMENVKRGDDPKMKAYVIGMSIAQQVNERMLPGMRKEFENTPDSILADLFYRGFTDALMKDTTVFTLNKAEDYFTEKQKADKAIRDRDRKSVL